MGRFPISYENGGYGADATGAIAYRGQKSKVWRREKTGSFAPVDLPDLPWPSW
jgi:hypothetical protein